MSEIKDKDLDNIFSEGYSLLPNKILNDPNITPAAKLLYCKISSLCAKEGYCWATNQYLAEQCNTTTITISNWLTQLEDYLIFENRSSYKRKIMISTLKKSLRYLKENFKQNKDNSNNISSKEDIKKMSKTSFREKKFLSKEEAENLPKNELIEYWNYLKEKNNIPIMSSMNRYYKRNDKFIQTSSYDETKRLFNSLLHGTFGSLVSIDSDFLDKNHIKKQYLSRKWTKEEIKKGLENLTKFFIKGYWPVDKKILPTDLLSLMYDAGYSNGKIKRKSKSYFLMAFYHPPHPINKGKTEEQIDNEHDYMVKGNISLKDVQKGLYENDENFKNQGRKAV